MVQKITYLGKRKGFAWRGRVIDYSKSHSFPLRVIVLFALLFLSFWKQSLDDFFVVI